jgi:hypothetical protein
MIPEPPQRLRQRRVVRGYHATFPGRQVLHRMEAEHGHVRNAAHALPPVVRAQRMAGVFNQERSLDSTPAASSPKAAHQARRDAPHSPPR